MSGTTFGIENTLLRSSLLCGLGEADAVAYRLQLFFVAAKDLDSGSHINDYQRALETGVDRKRFWKNAGSRGSGEYSLTHAGRQAALALAKHIPQRYPATRKRDFRVGMRGTVVTVGVEIDTHADKAVVRLDGVASASAAAACRELNRRCGLDLRPAGTSAVRVLYDLGIDSGFEIKF